MIPHLLRIELRRGWPNLVLLAALTALVVTVSLASLGGARRSASAFDRYLDALRGPEAAAFGAPHALARLGELDAVEAAIDFELVSAMPVSDTEGFYPLVVDTSGRIPYERMRVPVVHGRLPARDAPLEVALGERTSRRLGVGVGDRLAVATYDAEATEAFTTDPTADPEPSGEAELAVVGIVRDPGDLAARESDITLTFLSPAFRDRFSEEAVGSLGRGTLIALEPGHELVEVSDAMAGEDVEIDDSFSAGAIELQIGPTMGAIGTALRVFATVVALSGLIAVGQATARMLHSARRDDLTLGALGVSGGQRWARLALPASIAVASGVVVGMVGAALASPLFPIGAARRAEPDPGFHLDLPALLAGGAAWVLALGTLVAGQALWRTRRPLAEAPSDPGTWLGRAAAGMGAPTPAVAGLSLASGTTGRPGRVAFLGTTLSVLGVLASVVFSSSVDRLLGSSQLYGWGWDATIEGADLTDLGDTRTASRRLAEDPAVEGAATLLTQLPATVDGAPTFATAVAEDHPALRPVVVRGEAPKGAGEIAVGGDTLRATGHDVGDLVELSLGGPPHRVEITGVVAFPVPEDGGSSSKGIFLSAASFQVLDAAAYCRDSDSCTTTIAVALDAGADVDAFVARHTDPDADIAVTLPAPPPEVERLTAVESLPRYLAVFLALLAVAAVSFATTTTVRQRRRDLAVLRVLGMRVPQVRLVVIVLVLALTSLGATLGTILGLIVGRQVWRATTASLYLPFAPSLPVLALVAVPVVALLLAQVVATASRRRAGRTPAALVLRAE